MDPREDDIEFDFFDDEPPTTEAQSTPRVRLPRRGGSGRGPRRTVRPPQGVTPLLRLLGLVIFVIALVLILILVLQSCAASSRHDSYASYMSRVAKIGSQSEGNGRKVAAALTTPGVKVGELENTLHGIADQERQLVQAAEDTDPPGRLRDENRHVVESLQLRVSGVDGLANTFRSTASSKTTAADSALLAEQADRLVASDVVWDDLFNAPAKAQLQRDGVQGVRIPDSNFVSNRALYSAESMARVLQRLRGAATGGTPTGLHGTNIVQVKALPSGKTLQTGTDNTIQAGTDLRFAVTIADSGDSQEVGIKITLTIDKPEKPIVKTQTVEFINPGQELTKTFGDLGEVPFATKTTLKVDVASVPGEKNTGNNSAQYPVIFSL